EHPAGPGPAIRSHLRAGLEADPGDCRIPGQAVRRRRTGETLIVGARRAVPLRGTVDGTAAKENYGQARPRGRHRVGLCRPAARAATPGLRASQLIVLESTTYPGTTRELLLPMLEESGLKVGVDFCLAFSPERIDPGNATYRLKNTPRVVGGITPTCRQAAVALYSQVVDKVVPVSSTEAAE